MILISAMTRNRVIGVGDRLPWSIPEEYRHFLERIRGQAVIMGRKSYEIFARDMVEAELFVVSRSARSLPNARVCHSVESAAEAASATGLEVFSAGGAQIYRLTLPLADRMYLSYVDVEAEGDATFPEFDPAEWEITSQEQFPRFEYVEYRRR